MCKLIVFFYLLVRTKFRHQLILVVAPMLFPHPLHNLGELVHPITTYCPLWYVSGLSFRVFLSFCLRSPNELVLEGFPMHGIPPVETI